MRLGSMWLASGFIIALLVAGCASFDGRGLVAGQSTAQDIERLMGPAADKRAGPGGETWLYYPRQPFGRKTFVASSKRLSKTKAWPCCCRLNESGFCSDS